MGDVKKLKKELKDLEKQIKDNKKKKILSQDEVWELEDRIAVLKEKIGEKKGSAGLSGLPDVGGRFCLQRNAALVFLLHAPVAHVNYPCEFNSRRRLRATVF